MSKLSGDWEQVKTAVNSVDFNLPTTIPANLSTHWLTQDFLARLFKAFGDANNTWEELKGNIFEYINLNMETEEYPVPEVVTSSGVSND